MHPPQSGRHKKEENKSSYRPSHPIAIALPEARRLGRKSMPVFMVPGEGRHEVVLTYH
jgi:hypothetical protein